KRIEEANIWLKALNTKLVKYDKNVMVFIVADHGGYVGLDYTNEIHERKLKDDEIFSTFSSILSIKWPNDVSAERLEFKTNVNLFRQIFYGLSKNNVFLKDPPNNSSYLQLKTEGEVIIYEALDDYKKPVFNQISED